MGQPLPLPKRIPNPDASIRQHMNDCGITLEDSEEQYVTYTLPKGWRLVDNSWRQDLPEFYIVNDENMVRYSITGSWKETYDNYLQLKIIDEPYKLKLRENKLIPSKTNTASVLGEFLQAIDPQHRPANRMPANRYKDYIGDE